MVLASNRGLDFFASCDAACKQVREHVRTSKGEIALQGMQWAILRDVDFLQHMPLQTLNDRLKLYPFVDPSSFDDLLAEMISAVLEWMQWVTDPDWIVEVIHAIGAINEKKKACEANAARDEADGGAPRNSGETLESLREEVEELEELAKFVYPLPLKLRDLQAMIRPFMEVRSHHFIHGLDAVVTELVRDLLRLYYTIKSWDEALVQHTRKLADATMEKKGEHVISLALCEFCSCMEFDVFEASHRLSHVDETKFPLTKGDIEIVCQKLPIFQDKVLLKGPPVATFSRGGHLQKLISGATGAKTAARQSPDSDNGRGNKTDYDEMRMEALSWWRKSLFGHGIGTGILASTLLTYFVEAGLHPDPHVASKLPEVLEALFGCQISCRVFMNKLLPKLGGYVDSHGIEVPAGQGLPLLNNVGRCAETILVFIRRWSDITRKLTDLDWSHSAARNNPGVSRGGEFDMDKLVQDLTGPKHDVHEVVNLLEGATPIPHHILNVPVDEKRYRVDEEAERLWEHTTGQFMDLSESLESHHRDLGPYVHINLENQGVDVITQPKGITSSVTSVKLAKPSSDREAMDQEVEATCKEFEAPQVDLSEVFGLRLVDWPRDAVGSGPESTSTFVSYFSETGRVVSRESLKGLPPLPWSFGTDKRNAIILDIPQGVAPFHCIFTRARAQAMRPCVLAFGGPLVPAYIVCPKYQPIQVQNGDRLVCHQWNFELRILPTGLHMSSLQILTDEGTIFDVPLDGCHVGAGNRSRRVPNQPSFPQTKFALKHRLKDMSAVHMVFSYHAPSNRWTLMDHSPDPLGTLLLLKTGIAYPLSHGSRVKLGPVILETVINP